MLLPTQKDAFQCWQPSPSVPQTSLARGTSPVGHGGNPAPGGDLPSVTGGMLMSLGGAQNLITRLPTAHLTPRPSLRASCPRGLSPVSRLLPAASPRCPPAPGEGALLAASPAGLQGINYSRNAPGAAGQEPTCHPGASSQGSPWRGGLVLHLIPSHSRRAGSKPS